MRIIASEVLPRPAPPAFRSLALVVPLAVRNLYRLPELLVSVVPLVTVWLLPRLLEMLELLPPLVEKPNSSLLTRKDAFMPALAPAVIEPIRLLLLPLRASIRLSTLASE